MALAYNKRYGRSLKGELENLGVGFDFGGVRNLISDIQYLKEYGIYDEFFYIFKNWEDPINVLTGAYKKLPSISPLLTKAISKGLTPEESNVFSGSVDYFSFYHFYRFLEWIYSMNLGRYLQEEDVKAVFSSDILEKIILGLENFDRVQSTRKFDNHFFQNIKEVEWTDKYTERFFDKLHDLLTSKSFNEIGNREASFKREMKRIVKFLAVCSTINKERIYITTTDIIIAYKTLFKIIRTDITDLVNKKAYKGLLVCPMCNGYYRLEEDETPDDFSQCSCGGTLTYVQSLEEVNYHGDAFKEQKIDKKSLIIGAGISLTLAMILINSLK